MPSRYETFDASKLHLQPLSQRQHDMNLSFLLPVGQTAEPFSHPDLPALAGRLVASRGKAANILMMGAHVIKEGLSLYVLDLMRRKLVDLVALNGAGVIHDFELARVGGTSESVARYIRTGEFGLWRETGELNDIVAAGAAEGLGLGEAVGREVVRRQFPHRDTSIVAAGYELGIPVTCHVSIGCDIIHQHPNFDGSAFGACSGRDFLIYARKVQNLEGGVLLCYGSAIMGPEVYLKALSMARNVARQQGRQIAHFTTAVFDLLALPEDIHTTPPRSEPAYYYRPFKTILVRTVSDGGRSYYIRGRHRATMPALHKEIVKLL